MKQESLLTDENPKVAVGSVECLGLTFANDEARRAHFTELLRQKLQDPEFKAIEGFPIGTDEAILELSDPPYYTACPNPWLSDFVELWESQKTDLDDEYHREPFAADVSEGKNDPIYNAHSYHTKVPHKAIMRYILHYTNPGDIVFDGFCGTGMTGVAAQMCGDKFTVEELGFIVDEVGNIFDPSIVEQDGSLRLLSKLGSRKTVLNDLSPAATFIANNYNKKTDVDLFLSSLESILFEIKTQYSWMYETNHDDENIGVINHVLWSDVFACPECDEEIVFWDSAVDYDHGQIKDSFFCGHCQASVNKKSLERIFISEFDRTLNNTIKVAKQKPVLINYSVGKKRFEKTPDEKDLINFSKIEEEIISYWIPCEELPLGSNTAQPKNSHGISHVHLFFPKSALALMSAYWEKSKVHTNVSKNLQLAFTAACGYTSKMRRFRADKKGGGPLAGTLYVASLITPSNPLLTIERNAKSIYKALNSLVLSDDNVVISSQSSTSLTSLDDNSLDYVFIDPPFGANINYSELNILWEGWLSVRTNNASEAIVNSTQNKNLDSYRQLMLSGFKEVYRLLKPGRWLTIEFSNTKASVWNSIQTALTEAGFIVANVSALDKKQGSFKAVTTTTAVKQDLVISAYKPSANIVMNFNKNHSQDKGVWEFIKSHLEYLTVAKIQSTELVKIPERDPRILFDQVVSFYIKKGYQVPLSSQKFQQGLIEKFVERDGMIFLPEQVAEYDKKRALSSQVKQLSIFVDDEASAIEWMRQELKSKPKTYSEINPLFLNELSGWKKNELSLELSTLLEQNFIKYDGVDEVPSQIHTYLSTNFKDMRGLGKDDLKLKAKAKDRWYVPDPNKAEDLENVRSRALLREFETYKTQKKIKLPRAEALRAGFKTAWEIQDFQTILDIAAKIPTDVLQEDEKLLMFYDNALTLTSTEEDEW
jgi:DNA modification methylase